MWVESPYILQLVHFNQGNIARVGAQISRIEHQNQVRSTGLDRAQIIFGHIACVDDSHIHFLH